MPHQRRGYEGGIQYRAGNRGDGVKAILFKFYFHDCAFLSLSWLYLSWLITSQQVPLLRDNKRHFLPIFKLKFPHLMRHGFMFPLLYKLRICDAFSFTCGGIRLDVIIILHLPALVGQVSRS